VEIDLKRRVEVGEVATVVRLFEKATREVDRAGTIEPRQQVGRYRRDRRDRPDFGGSPARAAYARPMAVQLNHTIVAARDKRESATFLSEILGLPAPVPFGPFLVVQADNGVSLDFADGDDEVRPQHYAFLISEDEFDQVYARVTGRNLTIWPHPWKADEGQINHNDGGRGFYFEDPSGHFLEVLTRPYGSGGR
jgi:catechol 2,3-dioxygenase-like lactoylglutathione lyase family enzyme